MSCKASKPVDLSIRARRFYLAFYSASRSFSTQCSTARASPRFRRSDFSSQGFTGSYDPEERTTGPLAGAPILGTPTITPRTLKHHLDQFVVGQERAKKILSVAVYNHYQRIQELLRKEAEENEMQQQRLRREMAEVHPVEDEFPGQRQAIALRPPTDYQEQIHQGSRGPRTAIIPPTSRFTAQEESTIDLEKTNILLLGPSGVGKTLMAKTLARALDVPFSMSDCTPFTQAGYIGEDAEICVSRLLAVADYDVAAAERGIICLDEIDKISAAKLASGKDVGGEGVQQSLLKIIEGTTLQIHAKQEHSSLNRNSTGSPSSSSPISGGVSMSPSSRPSNSGAGSGASKAETYNVRTDNILFICAGAFTGLHKTIMSRIAQGSIGFGAQLRSSPPSITSSSSSIGPGKDSADMSISVKPGSPEHKLFEKHLPYYTSSSSSDEPNPRSSSSRDSENIAYNPLDLLHPTDLQTFGLIPELIGRLPVTAALSSLDATALVRVLTEPRNSLIRQYESLFSLSGIELRFTTPALHAIAESALDMGTGARGLRTVCERLLTDTMFEVPGSSVKYILITEKVAKRESAPIYFSRGQQVKMRELLESEEDDWTRRQEPEDMVSNHEKGKNGLEHGSDGSFEEYRQRTTAVGAG